MFVCLRLRTHACCALLQRFAEALEGSSRPSADAFAHAAEVVHSLTQFQSPLLTRGDGQRALGSLSDRQRIVREQMLLDICERIIRACFRGLTSVASAAAASPDGGGELALVRACYDFIAAAFAGNSRNQMHCAQWIPVFMRDLYRSSELRADVTLLALLSGNRGVIREAVPAALLEELCGQLEEKLDARFAILLAAVCCVGDAPLEENQDFVVSRLFDDARAPEMSVTVQLGPATPTPACPSGVTVSFRAFGGGEKVRIETFLERATGGQQALLAALVSLFASLCMGRNYNGIGVASKLAPFDVLFRLVSADGVPSAVRAPFARLMLHAHADCEPLVELQQPSLTRAYATAGAAVAQRGAVANLVAVGEELRARYEPLRAWLVAVLWPHPPRLGGQGGAHPRAGEAVSDLELKLEVLRLARSLLLFGVYADAEEIGELIVPIIALLTALAPVSPGGETSDKNAIPRLAPAPKTERIAADEGLDEPGAALVPAIVVGIGAVLNVVANIRTDWRLSVFLAGHATGALNAEDGVRTPRAFRNRVAASPSSGGAAENHRGRMASPREIALFTDLFGDKDPLGSGVAFGEGFAKALLSLTMDPRHDIALTAFDVFVRHYSQMHELSAALGQLQVRALHMRGALLRHSARP